MNDLYFTAKNKKGLKDQSLSQKVYLIRHEVAGYHPSENEYISLSGEYLIKSQRNTPSVMIYECISRNRRVIHSMICQVCDLDKKSRIKMIRLFWSEWQDSNLRHLAPKASALPTALHPVAYIIFFSFYWIFRNRVQVARYACIPVSSHSRKSSPHKPRLASLLALETSRRKNYYQSFFSSSPTALHPEVFWV